MAKSSGLNKQTKIRYTHPGLKGRERNPLQPAINNQGPIPVGKGKKTR